MLCSPSALRLAHKAPQAWEVAPGFPWTWAWELKTLPDILQHRVPESGHGALLPSPGHVLHARPARAPAHGHLPRPTATLPPNCCWLQPKAAGADTWWHRWHWHPALRASSPPRRAAPPPSPGHSPGRHEAARWPRSAGLSSRESPVSPGPGSVQGAGPPLLRTLALQPAGPAALGHLTPPWPRFLRPTC